MMAGRPVHRLLAPFPIAFLVGALASDLNFWWTGKPFWADAALWLSCGGLLTGAVASAAAVIALRSVEPACRRMPAAAVFGDGLVLLLTLWSVVHRFGDPIDAALPLGFILSAAAVLVLYIDGGIGGELTGRARAAGLARDARASKKR